MVTKSHQDAMEKSNRVFSKKVMLAAFSVLVVIAVILSVLWLGGDEGDLFSLNQVHGGILCSVHLDSTNWTHKYLKIENGDRNVFWSLQSANLSAGTWAVEEYEPQPLGDVLLRLHVIDAEGDGRMGQGDSIVVTTSDSAGFSPDLIYSFALWQGHIAISGVVSKMSFWYEDGQLATSSMETIVYPY